MTIQILIDFYFLHYKNFWFVWPLPLIFLIVIHSLLFNGQKKYKQQKIYWLQKIENIFSRKSYPTLISVSLFLVFLGIYIFLIFYKEEFAYLDHWQFTSFSLKGRPYGMPMSPETGRFWPFGLQEYNFLSILGKSPILYHSFSVFQLIVVILIVNKLINQFKIWYRLLVIALIMITPSFVISYFGLIFAERNVIFWLSILLLSTHYYSKSGKAFYLYVVLFAAQILIYYKEPVFLLVGGFAIARLMLIIWKNKVIIKKNKKNSSLKFKFIKKVYLEIALLILCAYYLLIYFIKIRPGITDQYGTLTSEPDIQAWSSLVKYLRIDLILIVFCLTCLSRIIYLQIKRQLPDYFWDTLALGAILYFLSYVRLNMFSVYYLAPIDFIAILYLSRFVYTFDATKKIVTSTVFVFILCLIVNQNLDYSSSHILYRKNYINGNYKLVSFLKNYSDVSHASSEILFFQGVKSNFHLMEFVAYLNYKGVDVFYENRSSNTRKLEFIIKADRNFPNNQCMAHAQFQCFPAQSPQTGDLVVVLPDNKLSSEELKLLNLESKLLFAYEPSYSLIEKALLTLGNSEQCPDHLMDLLHPLWYSEQCPNNQMNAYIYQKY